MLRPSIIAIDGPVAAGKTTVGKALASRLGYRFVDTGLMYRAVTWAALRDGIAPDDEATVAELARRIHLEMASGNGLEGSRIIVDSQDVTDELRNREVESAVSWSSRLPEVRRAMVTLQRTLAVEGKIVMAGRDIGTVVLPDADMKIFLTASPERRARRRQIDMEGDGRILSIAQVLAGLSQRDQMDTQRADSPLEVGNGAHIMNTEHLSLHQVVERIMALMEVQ